MEISQQRTLASPCGSMMSLSPSVEADGKKTMQTTVAIVEENPHRFKIQPLKQVPVEKRPIASPSVNFERPYVGCRLGLPTMYQLAPSRTASTYSFNSVNSDSGATQTTLAEPTSPAPDSVFEYYTDMAAEKEGEGRYAGLGFADLLDGASLATTSAHASFSSQVSNYTRSVSSSQSHRSQDASWMEFSGPDLTFAPSEDSSAHSRIHTPASDTSGMPPSNSTESSRKAKSMMILDSLSKSAIAYQSTSELELLPSVSSGSLRRLKAKTLSVSTSAKAHMSRHKRHAIYGQDSMQFSLSSGTDKRLFSTTPSTPDQELDAKALEPSPCILAVERKAAALPKKSSLVPSKRILNFLDPNRAAPGALLAVPTGSQKSTRAAFARAVEPLRVTGTRSTQLLQKLVRSSTQDRPALANTRSHPLIEDLVHEIDLAISEWRVVPYV